MRICDLFNYTTRLNNNEKLIQQLQVPSRHNLAEVFKVEWCWTYFLLTRIQNLYRQ